ncbi:MAG: glycosyl hydrolase family 2 [Prevotella sp.]|nr:glycosyl hydrolase family 2 [Prevotella sp.]
MKHNPLYLCNSVRSLAVLALSFIIFPLSFSPAGAQSWPTPSREAKAGARWWWLGSAVDRENLQWNLQQYAQHGIGAVEITPIYGVQGNQANNIPFLSDEWMEMLRYTQQQAERNGIEVDMATGTGWPFGGPWVPLEESACKAVFVEKTFEGNSVADLDLSPAENDARNAVLHKVMLYTADGQAIDVTNNVTNGKLTLNPPPSNLNSQPSNLNSQTNKIIALYIKYGVMRVKRAAPGGEGLVIDHFDRTAVQHYLQHIEAAFERTHTPYPHTFFNDSYEVEAATWTPSLLREFEVRRGYKLEDHLPELLHPETIEAPLGAVGGASVLADYRETLGDLLLENFTQQWTAWAHRHGAITRNQAHGSPANLIDCYAAVDIPEIEGFGLSDLGIRGLRRDSGMTRRNDSDYSMFKYAPSAAHVCGKPYTSSETFTWLTEHFRTSLSQLKPDLDLMFCAGVNHIFFHGTCYSPRNDEWPGWKFYASIDMSPTNSIWRDAPYFMQYVERCQSFLQWGQPDNDFLVLLPVRDAWQKQTGKLLMQFSIHAMGRLMPEFRDAILAIDRAGFDCDYISERLLMNTRCENGLLVTEGGSRYKGLIIPGSGNMPETVRQHIEELRRQGAHIMFGINADEMSQVAKPEPMKTQLGLKAIRRSNANGYHYFMANLTPSDINTRIPLAVSCRQAFWFNPLNGDICPADINAEGLAVNLRSGESMILQTFSEAMPINNNVQITNNNSRTAMSDIVLQGPWTLSFTEEAPSVGRSFTLDRLQTWETLDDQTRVTMGTGIYTTHLRMTKSQDPTGPWKIDLGDVRESARVYINGQFIGCAWSVPFILDTKGALKVGDNEVSIEVTNLPANRIAELDRQGGQWRKMEEINVVNINYKRTLYDQWAPMPSGLNSEVKLIR